MGHSLVLLVLLGLLYLQAVVADVYRVILKTGFSGTTDRVSIILVGQGGTETGAHDLPGPFDRNSVKPFSITDRRVGTVSAVKIRSIQQGEWKYWYLLQVIVVASGRYYTFHFKDFVKYGQWNTISQKCSKGFKKSLSGTCVDIDECNESDGCPDKIATCHNTIGSFSCKCPFGYNTNYLGRCIDIDECRTNKGGCQERCLNSPGSYSCGCYFSGYRLVGGYRCEDIDECSEGKDNCDRATTICRNSPGSFACYCKQGYENMNNSSCERVTCSSLSASRDSHGTLAPARCFHQGQNKYQDKCKVVCNHGYVPKTPSAVNASCGPYGNWVPYPTTCTGRPCPKLADFANGYVEYSCKHATKRYGENCLYRCNGGYKLRGNEYRECRADGTWTGSVPTCDKIHQKPRINCPSSISVVLKPGMNTSDVSDRWKRPTAIYATNITAVDPPGVSGSYQFPVGKTIVRWIAVNAIGDQDVCVVHVDVYDRESPKVVFCPEKIFKVTFKTDPIWVNITKPVFTDNVGVVRHVPPLIDGISTSNNRNFLFTAYDAAGNSADCRVEVHVGGFRCQLPPEGPPDGTWLCNSFGGSQYCIRSCAQGQKLFGANLYWLCNANEDGKWKSYPQPGLITHCVGYKNVNVSDPCPAGSVRNSSFGSGCFECPIGTYYNNGSCEACAEGKFQDQTGQTSCKPCPVGTWSFQRSWSCRPVCPPGRYSKDGLGPFCEFCSNGTFQDEAQKTSCLQCPIGTNTLHIGATFCGRSPQITKVEPGSVATVGAGENVTLKCFSGGEPTPFVFWQYPDNSEGFKTQEQMKDKDGKILGTQVTITNMDASDGGAYTCVSGNAHGEITHKVQLTLTASSSKGSLVKNNDIRITANKRTPKAARGLCPAGAYSSDGLGPLCRVCPKDKYQDQAGMTACKNCANGTETLQLAAASSDNCGVSPTITSVNSSVNTTSGEAKLDCHAHASPTPLVTWRITEDIPSDFLGLPKLEQLVDNEGKPIGTRLIIRAITSYDAGRYECTAVNPHGQDKKTLDLTIF